MLLQFNDNIKRNTIQVFNVYSPLRISPVLVQSRFLGVHIRRGEMHRPIGYIFGYNLPSLSYYNQAMQYYNTRYGHSKVLFIIGSDEIEWCQNISVCLFLVGTAAEDLDV